MKNFARSQVDQVMGGEYTVTNPVNNYTTIQRRDGKKPNKPVNMDLVKTFYPAGSSEDTYSIVFEIPVGGARDGITYVSWFYPPHESGKAMRDADLTFLYNTFAIKCPVNDPTVPR